MKLRYFSSTNYNHVELPSLIFQRAVGQLLRDAHAEKSSKTSNTRLSWSFGAKYIDYRSYIANLFKNYCGTGLKSLIVRAKKNNDFYTSYRLKTLSLPLFNKLHDIFYVLNNKTDKFVKVVPASMHELISPIVLAHLIIGDGGFDKTRNRVRIFTYSYSYSDCKRLAESISAINVKTQVMLDRKNRQNIEQYILTIGGSEIYKLRKLVVPYIVSSILYRVGI